MLNEETTIQSFASSVKAAGFGRTFDDLAKVIPAQYLNSTEENAVFKYSGKEYGFYVVKDGEYFDVLIIDFIYDFNDEGHINNEQLMRIEPILQQSFIRQVKTDGSYTWAKSGEPRNRYYVANPRFLVEVQNENTKNAYDVGYSIDNDEGLVITQSRVNYGKVCYLNELSNAFEIAKITVKTVVNAGIGLINDYGILSDCLTLMDGLAGLKDARVESVVESNNETNIFTENSKSVQKTWGAYARVAGFAPIEEIVLSSDSDSYMEFITLFNESNYTSRFTQVCEFDIVCRGNSYSTPTIVDTNESVIRQKVLFEDQAPYFEIGGRAFEDASTDLYIFGGASQTVKFIPYYTGNYTFTVLAGLSLSVNGAECTLVNNKYSAKLQNDQAYYFKLTNTTSSLINNVSLTSNLDAIDTGGVSIDGNSRLLVGYTTDDMDVLKVTLSNANCNFSIYDSSLNLIKQSTNNYCFYHLLPGVKYYLLIHNNSTATQNVSVTTEFNIPSYANEQQYNVSFVEEELYLNFSLEEGLYLFECTIPTTATFGGCVQDIAMQTIIDTTSGKTIMEILSGADQTVTFRFTGAGTLGFIMKSADNNYLWEVDGETYLTETATSGTRLDTNFQNKLYIKRGTRAFVKLKVGTIYLTEYLKVGSYEGFSYSADNELIITNECALTSDDGSNVYYIQAFYAAYRVATLNIYVINDNTDITAYAYSDNDGFGLAFSTISSVSGTATVSYKLGSYATVRQATVSCSGGQINVMSVAQSYSDLPVVFNITIVELKLGSTTLFSTDTSITNQVNMQNVIAANKYFNTGSGTLANPYTLTCQRHLNNIRYDYKVDRTDDSKYIDSAYRLLLDITLTGTWTPIEHNFKGEFYGNGKKIYNLTMSVGNNGYYGLFGRIQNAYIEYLEIKGVYINGTPVNNNSQKTLQVGTIAGYNGSGRLVGCSVINNGSGNYISVNSYLGTSVGGLVGFNAGRIEECYYSYVPITCSGNGGGIAGVNFGTISDCSVLETTITYVWREDNGRIGGIAGDNMSGASITGCSTSGTMVWTSPSTDTSIKPAMGYIIGYNQGTYSDCDTLMTNDIDYHWQFMFPNYDQSKRCFKVDNGLVGYNA